MSRLTLYALGLMTTLVVVYSLNVLFHVHRSNELGLECLLTNEWEDLGSTSTAPVVRRTAFRPNDVDVVGRQPASGDSILAIAGRPISTYLHFKRLAASLPGPLQAGATFDPQEVTDRSRLVELPAEVNLARLAGDHWVRVRLRRSQAGTATPAEFDTWLRVRAVPTRSVVLSMAWMLLEMMLLVIGALVIWKRPDDILGMLFYCLCCVSVVTFMGLFHWPTLVGVPSLTYPFVFCSLLLAPMTLHFYLLFPRPVRLVVRHGPVVFTAIYAVAALTNALMFAALVRVAWLYDQPAAAVDLNVALDFLVVSIYGSLTLSLILFLMGLLVLTYGFLTARSAAERAQVRWILGAAVLAMPVTVYLFHTAATDRASFAFGASTRWMIYLLSVIFTVSYAVSLTRYRLMNVGRTLNRGLAYVVISLSATAVFCLMVGTVTALVGRYYFRWENALAAGLTAMVVVIILDRIRDRLQRVLEHRFLRQKHYLDKAMNRLGAAVDQLIEPEQLARRMLNSACDAVAAQYGSIYLKRQGQSGFVLAAQQDGPTPPDQLDAGSPTVSALTGGGLLTSRAGLGVLPSPAQQQLREMDVDLAFAIQLESTALGIVLLGPRHDDRPYSAEDRTFLLALVSTTALALRSAQGHRTIDSLKEKLQGKLEKIAEQQQRIHFLQGELLNRNRASAKPTQRADPILTADGQPTLEHQIRGSSPAIRHLIRQVAKIAASSSSILIRGESGTGKELLARAIHDNSNRKEQPFVAVQCAALSSSLLESELFGHVKGAFTGADRDRIGRFQSAHRGTLFLDEIGDINLETQTKLLRVLQEKTFEPVGGTHGVAIDVRLVAATHRDLEALIRIGHFREDLFYRLNVITVVCPPLRDRGDDLFQLAMHFLALYSNQAGKKISHIDAGALEALAAYPWPGNIRQLENAVERAVVLAEGDFITIEDLPPEVTATAAHPRRATAAAATGLGRMSQRRPRLMVQTVSGLEPGDGFTDEVVDLQRRRLSDALAHAGGNKSQAARLLGIPRSTFFSQLRRFDVE